MLNKHFELTQGEVNAFPVEKWLGSVNALELEELLDTVPDFDPSACVLSSVPGPGSQIWSEGASTAAIFTAHHAEEDAEFEKMIGYAPHPDGDIGVRSTSQEAMEMWKHWGCDDVHAFTKTFDEWKSSTAEKIDAAGGNWSLWDGHKWSLFTGNDANIGIAKLGASDIAMGETRIRDFISELTPKTDAAAPDHNFQQLVISKISKMSVRRPLPTHVLIKGESFQVLNGLVPDGARGLWNKAVNNGFICDDAMLPEVIKAFEMVGNLISKDTDALVDLVEYNRNARKFGAAQEGDKDYWDKMLNTGLEASIHAPGHGIGKDAGLEGSIYAFGNDTAMKEFAGNVLANKANCSSIHAPILKNLSSNALPGNPNVKNPANLNRASGLSNSIHPINSTPVPKKAAYNYKTGRYITAEIPPNVPTSPRLVRTGGTRYGALLRASSTRVGAHTRPVPPNPPKNPWPTPKPSHGKSYALHRIAAKKTSGSGAVALRPPQHLLKIYEWVPLPITHAVVPRPKKQPEIPRVYPPVTNLLRPPLHTQHGWVECEVVENSKEFFNGANQTILLEEGKFDRCGVAGNGRFDASKYGVPRNAPRRIPSMLPSTVFPRMLRGDRWH